MRLFRWLVLLSLVGLVAGFFHYTLPQRDVVRIVDTEVSRQDFSNLNRVFYAGGDSGGPTGRESRDVRFIQTLTPDGDTRVYRNEDTGLLGWPPYFKTSSQDLQTEAAALVSDDSAPRWVLVEHYGWRSTWLSIYPNALSLREVQDPAEVSWVPWPALIRLAIFAVLAIAGVVGVLGAEGPVRRPGRRPRGRPRPERRGPDPRLVHARLVSGTGPPVPAKSPSIFCHAPSP